MSLLDRAPHTVTVQRRIIDRTDVHGVTYQPDGAPVDVRGSLQPLSATETNVDGIAALTRMRFICRDWPGDIHSKITADGVTFEPEGQPQFYNMSAATRHWEVVLRRA